MMHNWFECKVRYDKVAENGMNKKVTEPYLVDALSFTEAEARIIEEITPFISLFSTLIRLEVKSIALKTNAFWFSLSRI